MNEPTEIKYSLDETGEPYFAATHIKGLFGLDFDGDDDLIVVLSNIQSEITELKSELNNQDTRITNMENELKDQNTRIEELEKVEQDTEDSTNEDVIIDDKSI
jgi:septal ring factor EnvC (AmiA/AmiB activator)